MSRGSRRVGHHQGKEDAQSLLRNLGTRVSSLRVSLLPALTDGVHRASVFLSIPHPVPARDLEHSGAGEQTRAERAAICSQPYA